MKNLAKNERQLKANRRYRKTRKIISLAFEKPYASRIDAKAISHGLQSPAYIKALIKSDMDKLPVLNINQLRTILKEIRRIGQNINQVVRYVHQSRRVKMKDVLKLQKALKELEDFIKTKLG